MALLVSSHLWETKIYVASRFSQTPSVVGCHVWKIASILGHCGHFLHPWKLLTWLAGKSPIFDRKYIFKWLVFHGHSLVFAGVASSINYLEEPLNLQFQSMSQQTSHDRFPPKGSVLEGNSPTISGKSCGWWNIIPFGQNNVVSLFKFHLGTLKTSKSLPNQIPSSLNEADARAFLQKEVQVSDETCRRCAGQRSHGGLDVLSARRNGEKWAPQFLRMPSDTEGNLWNRIWRLDGLVPPHFFKDATKELFDLSRISQLFIYMFIW